MPLFKPNALTFTGELHDVHLVNFSVDLDEVRHLVPQPLRIRTFDGRALISMVDVHLRNMRAKSRLLPFRFHYQHVGFRLLIEDANYHNESVHKGIYFLRSFTNRSTIATGGKLLTRYNLEHAQLLNHASGLEIRQGDNFLVYSLDAIDETPSPAMQRLHQTVGAIDRAWAVDGRDLKMTRIMREKWPL
ncbi:MAG: DUF2071 domain-containing protein, partial [Bacteroidota bacterium]